MTSFHQFHLDDFILKSLKELNYKKPMEVQEKVIPCILNKKDAIVKSKTGSGKTASFAIPICNEIIWEENQAQALILTPTRELAIQIQEDMVHIGLYKRLKTTALYGRTPYKTQLQELKQKVHAVVGTPGRVLDHIKRGSFITNNIKYLVIDEADEMLNMGFVEVVKDIIDSLPIERVNLLFSATMPNSIQELALSFMKEPMFIEIKDYTDINENIEHQLYFVDEKDKNDLLLSLLCCELPESVIIFANTQEKVNDIFHFLDKHKISCDYLHGGMLQEDRIRNIKDFKQGKYRVLVASDVAARGIDIDSLTCVIHYELPFEKEKYVHRSGRTARINKKGKSIAFVCKYEKQRVEELKDSYQIQFDEKDKSAMLLLGVNEKSLKVLASHPKEKEDKYKMLKQGVLRLYINGGKLKKIRSGDIVGAICEIDGVNSTDIGVIRIQDHVSYVEILNHKGDIVLKNLKMIKKKNVKVELAKSED